MSLHHLAKHMQSQGRDGDTGLVHMSPGEIGALQKLAMANGGSLTVNPETGLPEAGFLKDFLPSIVGGLAILAAPFTGGMSLLGAAALGGGLAFGTSMAVGNSFKKSLFTGLMTGAGGAATAGLGGLGAGAAGAVGKTALQAGAGTALRTAPQIAAAELGGVGSTALTQGALRSGGVKAAESLGSKALSSTLSTAAPRVFSAEAQQLAQQGAQRGLTQEAGMLAQPGRIFAGAAPRPGVTTGLDSLRPLTTQEIALQDAALTRGLPMRGGPLEAQRATPYTSYTAKPIEPLPANYGPSSYGGTQAPAPISDISSVASGADKYANLSMGDKLAAQGKGVEKLFTEKGAAKQFVTENKGPLALAGIGAIGSRLSDPQPGLRAPPPEVSTYAGPYKPVERTAQFQIGPQAYTDTSEFQYFNDVNPYPGVVPYKAAAGGLMGLAGGGSYDDEAGQDGYADGGEVGTRMATPDMTAIQNYVQSISPQQQGDPNALQNYMQSLSPQQGDPNALQNYLNNIGRQQQQPTSGRPQVPDILRQLQATPQQAPQIQAPIGGGERNYGFKPITVQQAPPVQYAPAPQPRNGRELLFSGMMGKKAEPVPIVDKYTPYRAQTIDATKPGGQKETMQYTDLNNRVYNPETQQLEMPFAMGGMTSLARGGSYLDGPGDGLSDSIPATIGNRQPARLADGEFVISADVVSDIGGGSSKAGAKKLHAMMDRVRQSAHGTKKQVKKLDDRKVLAA